MQPRLELLTPDLIARILDEAIQLMVKPGIKVQASEARDLLARLAERGSWETWEGGGRQGMVERAQAEAERILHAHQVPPLDEVQERELDALLLAAEKELTR
jgi:trimethylamine:corrinoid methyltransferase-like protein